MRLPKVNPPVRHHRGQFWQNLHTGIKASVIVSQPRDVYDSSTKPTEQPASSRQALHPLRRTTPVTRRYTRYVALHPLRGTAPDQKRCNAHGSGAAPLDTSITAGSSGRTCTQVSKRQSLSLSRATCMTQARSRRNNRLHPGKHCTRYEALHPLHRTTPVTRHCTRSEEVQCPRIGCSTSGYKHHCRQFWQNLHTGIEASVIISQPRDVYDSSTKPTKQPASSRQALHPLRGATPVTSHYTRYEALHPIRRGAMPTDRVHLHSQQIPSRPHDYVTHRPMGTLPLPLPAVDETTGFIPASTAPVTGRYTLYVALHPIRRGAMPTDRVHLHSQQKPSWPHNPGESHAHSSYLRSETPARSQTPAHCGRDCRTLAWPHTAP